MQRLLKQREKMMLFNQKYWGKLARKEWLVNGDRNSKFFQYKANFKRKRKLVMKLQNDCGIWDGDHKMIAQKFISDYQQRFKSMHNPTRVLPELGLPKLISNLDNNELIKLPNLDEVKTTLFSIDSNKTPGPDGFGAGFFKHYWHLIKKDLFNCVLEFFVSGKILKEINHTFIALIAKTSSPSQISHFRPISLCSTIYKIILKILVNRMRPLLDRLISPFQSAFIPGRSIHDNILLTHEIMHKFRNMRTKMAWTTIKLDMEKAYDQLEWDFILQCLQELGFHPI